MSLIIIPPGFATLQNHGELIRVAPLVYIGKAKSSSQTCVDVVGQPQVSLIDFGNLSGTTFATGGVGLSFIAQPPGFEVDPIGIWFQITIESQPNLSSYGVSSYLMVPLIITYQPSDITDALSSLINSIYGGDWTADVISGLAFNSACQLTATQNVYLPEVFDINTGAAFSQTQPGYPSGHYCTPTSDALAGISFAFRGQCTYLGVTNNAGGLGNPGYTTQDLNGNQLLFQDSSMTVPAVNQGDTVAAIKDPISGLSAIQANSMLCPQLQFSTNALGMLVPWLSFTSDSLVCPLSFSQPVTYVCGAKNTGSNSSYGAIVDGVPGRGFLGYATSSGNIALFAGGSIIDSGVLPPSGFNVVSTLLNGASSALWLNGSSLTISGNPGTDSVTDVIIGNQSGTIPLTGGISAVLIAVGSITGRSTVEDYVETLNP